MVRMITGLLMIGATLTTAHAATVPFVGCQSDGQVGPQPAPREGRAPDVPAYAVSKLAYYAMASGPALLAPRGWHCFGVYGSNGASLVVAPRRLDWEVVTGKGGFVGPAIQLRISDGGTSGRFEVAEVAARLFPAAKDFVDRVEAEGLTDKPYVRHPYQDDKITRRGPYQALFTTPAGKEGLGTLSYLRAGTLPVDGVTIFDPQDDVALIHLSARLPAEQRPLVAVIIAQVSKRP